MVFRYLKQLVIDGKIIKIGQAPKVFYALKREQKVDSPKSSVLSNVVEENFNLITATGEEIPGMTGFEKWCHDRKLNIEDMITKYEEQISYYKKFINNYYIDASKKLDSFGVDKSLDKLVYLDFYSYPVFGRTKISNWLFYGKTLQQKDLMNRVIEQTKTKIFNFIIDQKVDSILFVPPSVPRKTQFMKILEDTLNINLPKIKITKIKTPITIQQKSLKDLGDRIKNAQTSLIVETKDTNYKRLLIIDDFTGSGATLNVVAQKCKKQKVAEMVFGLTITGSINGFEVIKEV